MALGGGREIRPSQGSQVASTEWQVVGTSNGKKPLKVRTLGSGPRIVLFIGGIHGDEPEGGYTTAQLPAAFTAAGLAETVTLTILENANPDGLEKHSRNNEKGVDLNRNFPAKNFDTTGGEKPLSQPESQAVAGLIDRLKPQLIIVMHSHSEGPFINFDGPAGSLAQRFRDASGMPVRDSSTLPTPGSLGSWAGRDNGIAVLTVEFDKGSDPAKDWETIRKALLEVIARP